MCFLCFDVWYRSVGGWLVFTMATTHQAGPAFPSNMQSPRSPGTVRPRRIVTHDEGYLFTKNRVQVWVGRRRRTSHDELKRTRGMADTLTHSENERVGESRNGLVPLPGGGRCSCTLDPVDPTFVKCRLNLSVSYQRTLRVGRGTGGARPIVPAHFRARSG